MPTECTVEPPQAFKRAIRFTSKTATGLLSSQDTFSCDLRLQDLAQLYLRNITIRVFAYVRIKYDDEVSSQPRTKSFAFCEIKVIFALRHEYSVSMPKKRTLCQAALSMSFFYAETLIMIPLLGNNFIKCTV